MGQTDIGNKQVIGGIALEFYQNIKKYYENPDNWIWQKKNEYKDRGQTRSSISENAMWTFEPSAALAVFNEMLNSEKIKIFYNDIRKNFYVYTKYFHFKKKSLIFPSVNSSL